MRNTSYIIRTLVPALFALALTAAPALSLSATAADALATAIITDLGYNKGVCAIPNCGNGQLARAFYQRSSMKVHAMDPDIADVNATGALLESINAYAPRAFVDKGTLALMPYVDRFASLIVITNITDANLSGISYVELERALAPDGKAWVGRATDEGAGVTQSALQNWINAATKAHSSAITSTSNGTWAVITRRELPGVDEWCHRGYDAGNSRHSQDQVAGFPWMPQAKFKPYHASNINADESDIPSRGFTSVSAGGILYVMMKEQSYWNVYMSAPTSWLRAFSVYNGELLWERNVNADALGNTNSGDKIVAVGKEVYLRRGSGSILKINGLTGAEMGTVSSIPSTPSAGAIPNKGLGGCGPYSANQRFTFKQGVLAWDLQADVARTSHLYKPPCGTLGTMVANGFMIIPQPTCNCGAGRMWSGHIEAPAPTGFDFEARTLQADGSDRIEQGPAFGNVTATVVPDASDWPTHRANIIRSGSSSVNVDTTTSRQGWSWAPPENFVTDTTACMYGSKPDRELTPPVVVGNYVFFGSTDSYVRCLNGTTGGLVWSYRTGGRVYSTPTVANGCVYVGSADGYAYCLEAHTGRLAWRFRAGPIDRRFGHYGYLSSVWPVNTGIMVVGDRAYFAGGFQSEYGAFLYCVNANTGSVIWQNTTASSTLKKSERLGYSPTGYLTIARNRLFAANSVGSTATFDITTGARDTDPAWLNNWGQQIRNGYPGYMTDHGREVGVVADQYLLMGGPYLNRDHSTRFNKTIYTQRFGFQKVDANGNPGENPKIVFSRNTLVTPAWDSNDFYQCMFNTDKMLMKFQIPAVVQAISTEATRTLASGQALAEAHNWEYEYDYSWDGSAAPPTWWPASGWANRNLAFVSIALTPNAIVATYAKRSEIPADPYGERVEIRQPEKCNWYVGLLSRSTGSVIWEKTLPGISGTQFKGEPLWNGLAITRYGTIVVTLRNGNVLCYPTSPTSVAQRPLDISEQPASVTTATTSSFAIQDAPRQPTAATQTASVQETPAQIHARAHGSCELAAALPRPSSSGLSIEPGDVRRDSVDMKVIDGIAMHTVSPAERTEMFHPRDMRWSPERACLPVIATTASSSATGKSPANAIDQKLTSLWQPGAAGRQYITCDLGAATEIEAVSVVWYALRRVKSMPLTVEVSLDGTTFEGVDVSNMTGSGTSNTLRTFVPQSARFVRVGVYVTNPSDRLGLYEVGVHAVAGDDLGRAQN